jgi:hypothetical protein
MLFDSFADVVLRNGREIILQVNLTRMLFLNVSIVQKAIAGTIIAIYILHIKSVIFIR